MRKGKREVSEDAARVAKVVEALQGHDWFCF